MKDALVGQISPPESAVSQMAVASASSHGSDDEDADTAPPTANEDKKERKWKMRDRSANWRTSYVSASTSCQPASRKAPVHSTVHSQSRQLPCSCAKVNWSCDPSHMTSLFRCGMAVPEHDGWFVVLESRVYDRESPSVLKL